MPGILPSQSPPPPPRRAAVMAWQDRIFDCNLGKCRDSEVEVRFASQEEWSQHVLASHTDEDVVALGGSFALRVPPADSTKTTSTIMEGSSSGVTAQAAARPNGACGF